MISIIIDIDDIEISMTADQALRLRDELNRLTGYQSTTPRQPDEFPGWPSPDQWRFKPLQPGTGDVPAYSPGYISTTDGVTVRQNGLEFKV